MANIPDDLKSPVKRALAAFRRYKKSNPVDKDRIMKGLSLSEDQFAELIHSMRMEGYPIGHRGGSGGTVPHSYFWCDKAEDMTGFLKDLYNRATRLSQEYAAMKRVHDRLLAEEKGLLDKEPDMFKGDTK